MHCEEYNALRRKQCVAKQCCRSNAIDHEAVQVATPVRTLLRFCSSCPPCPRCFKTPHVEDTSTCGRTQGTKLKFPQKEFLFFSQTEKAINVSNLNEPYVFNENVMLFFGIKYQYFWRLLKYRSGVF